MLWAMDQRGNNYGPLDPAAPRKSLLELTARKTASPMYRDGPDPRQVGYVIRPLRNSNEIELWCELYWTFGWHKGQPRPTPTE